MNETTTLGSYLRRERERRGLTLRTISENTKVSLALLEGLEADDISRWPGGIFRRAFVRSYAQCVGLDPDVIYRRFEEQFRPSDPDPIGVAAPTLPTPGARAHVSAANQRAVGRPVPPPTRSRLLGTAADLTVAVVLAFGSAAAGSRLLWPVLLIAGYYALGILLTGTSPMVALLNEQAAPPPVPASAPPDTPAVAQPSKNARHGVEARHQSRRRGGFRQRRDMQPRVS